VTDNEEATSAPSHDDARLRFNTLEHTWNKAIDSKLASMNDAERVDYHRRLDAAKALIEGYTRASTRRQTYSPWVGGEFEFAVASLLILGLLGLGLSMFEFFSDIKLFVQDHSVFILLIALWVGLGWARYAVEIETRRSATIESVEQYLSNWKVLGLSYHLIHDFFRENEFWSKENFEDRLADEKRFEKQIAEVRLTFELRVELLTAINQQRHKGFYFYDSDETFGLSLEEFSKLEREQNKKWMD
jgi:hypothetical protein